MEIATVKTFYLIFTLLVFPIVAASECDTLCKNLNDDSDRARCYSCKCKEAMDGWLPSTAELQCANTEEIVTYRTKNEASPDLEAITTEVSACHNPARFGGSCAPGSRLGQLKHQDVLIKWICRRNLFTPKYQDPTLNFDKVAAIAHNQRTGATCFWEGLGDTIALKNFPSLDITKASTHEVNEYRRHFGVSEGFGCIYCHDNDPFLYSPYLRSAKWKSDDYMKGPYSRVVMKGPAVAIGTKMLVSSEAKRCTSCHRISNGRSCLGWIADSVGDSKDDGFERSALNAIDKKTLENGSVVRKPGNQWQLAYWMPPGFDSSFPTWAQWHDRFGVAKEHILKCCAEVNSGSTSPECKWAPVPNH